MKPVKVAITYIIGLAVEAKILFMELTVTKMADPVYANPLIPLSTMSQLIQNLQDAWNSKNKAAIKTALAALNKAIRRQCLFIDVVADGSETIITNAGFVATSSAIVAAAPLTKPTAPILTHGATGCIKKTSQPLAGAKNYITIITANPALPIDISGDCIVVTPLTGDKVIIDSKASTKATYSGLPSGTRVYVTIIAYNKLGKSPMSDTVNIMVP